MPLNWWQQLLEAKDLKIRWWLGLQQKTNGINVELLGIIQDKMYIFALILKKIIIILIHVLLRQKIKWFIGCDAKRIRFSVFR